ncbi:E3 ubiquitin-protein ligase TRIM56-like [Glandiceps talaboti]
MAASKPVLPDSKEKVLADIDSKVLLCPICMERFKSPKVLPCFHSFCEHCLTEWVKANKGDLTCPTCKQSWPMTPEGVSGLTNNYFMNDLLELMQEVSLETNTSKCAGCDGEVKFWCTDCGEFLCEGCSTAHRRMRLSKDHRIMTIMDYNDQKSSHHMKLHQPRFCDDHPTVQLEFFCDSCQVPACMKCAVVTHVVPDHKMMSMEKALEKYTPTMKGYSEKFAKNVADLKHTKDKAIGKERELQQNKATAVKEVKKVTKNLHDEVTKQESRLLNDIDDIYHPKHKQISAHIDHLEQKLGSAESTYSYLNHLLTYGGPVDIMAAKKELDQHLMDGKQTDTSDSEDLDSNLVFTENPQYLTIDPGHLDCDGLQAAAEHFSNKLKTPEIKVGDRVRVRQSVTKPKYNWGSVTHQSIGTVTVVNGADIRVAFPTVKFDWLGKIMEMELVP